MTTIKRSLTEVRKEPLESGELGSINFNGG